MEKKLYLLFFILLLTAEIYPQWVQTNGPYDNVVNCLTLRGTTLFASTYDPRGFWDSNGYTKSHIYYSDDNGTTWIRIDPRLKETPIICIDFSPEINDSIKIFAGGYGIFLSTNNGTNWKRVEMGERDDLPIFSFLFHPDGKRIFAGANGGVFLTTDNGNIWRETGLSKLVVTCFTISPDGTDDYNLFVGTGWGSGIFLLTANDTIWHPINSGLENNPTGQIPWITSLTHIGSNIFASTGCGMGGPGHGIFLTTNNGASWSAVNNGLPKNKIDTSNFACINTLVVDDLNIFAGGEQGVFVSTDYGTNWIEVNTGLPNDAFISALAISNEEKNGKYIFAAVDSSVWRRSLSELITDIKTTSKLPKDFALLQNYPNPFNPSTTIKYSIPSIEKRHASSVQLKIFNVLGQEVATLVSEEKPAGTYEMTWNARNLSSGVYFYQLRAGSYIVTKKLLLLK